VRHTLSDLRPGDTAARLEDLAADLSVLLLRRGLSHKVVPEGVSCADNLSLLDEVGIEDGRSHAHPVHLANKYLVAKQVTAEEAAVRVGDVLARLASHVRQVCKQGVSGIVLLLAVVEVLSVPLDVVVADHVLQEHEGVVVLVVH